MKVNEFHVFDKIDIGTENRFPELFVFQTKSKVNENGLAWSGWAFVAITSLIKFICWPKKRQRTRLARDSDRAGRLVLGGRLQSQADTFSLEILLSFTMPAIMDFFTYSNYNFLMSFRLFFISSSKSLTLPPFSHDIVISLRNAVPVMDALFEISFARVDVALHASWIIKLLTKADWRW